MTGQRPLPDVADPLTGPFWAAAAQRRLVVQACPECGYRRWPPGPLCPECQAEGGTWTEISPTGTLWSIATYHRALDPAFADDVPYTVGLVELDDGPRMYGRMSGDPAAFRLDGRVRATFSEVAPGVTLVGWVPADATDHGPVRTGERGDPHGVR